jgi:solute:Na+ symporter, SSS family
VPILTAVDWLILLLSVVFAVGIGSALRPAMKSSNEYLFAGRALPAWICTLAFLTASIGAPEMIGMGAWGARYGLQAAQFYGIGAIPAMLFAGLVLMPLYYGSKARSLPEFLGLRFDQKTRILHACAVALMAVFSSGISLYVIAKTIQALQLFDGIFRTLGWDQHRVFGVVILLSAAIVLAYLLCGGLAAAMYNQAIQFVLLIAAFLPMVLLGLRNIGGWSGLKAALPDAQMHLWKGLAHSGSNPMGLEMVGLTLGLGVVLGSSICCTDSRVMQTAMAAKDLDSARRVPLLAAMPRLLLPLLVILPGLLAIALPTPRTTVSMRIDGDTIVRTTNVVRPEAEAGRGLVPAQLDSATGKIMRDANGQPLLNYEMATPYLLVHYLPTGLLGLGLAALLACLMGGVAANATAFNAVVTHDLYPSLRQNQLGDPHLLSVARWVTLGGLLLSVAAAFAASGFGSVMDALVMGFSLLSAPLVATFLLGIFWKRATGHGAFLGLVAGFGVALLHYGLTLPLAAHAGLQGGWIAVLHSYPSQIAQSLWTAIFAFCANLIVTALVSLATQVRPEAELVGLVYSLTPRPPVTKAVWWKQPCTLATAILLFAVALNILFA